MNSRIRPVLVLYFLGLLCAYAAFALWVAPDGEAFAAYKHFFFVGVFAAIIANSSAVGGGVVFVPFFTALNDLEARGAVSGLLAGGALTPFMTVGLSFAIQAFGMSVGTITWLFRFYVSGRAPPGPRMEFGEFARLAGLALVTCIPTMLLMQIFVEVDNRVLLTGFKAFSIVMGTVLFVFAVLAKKRSNPRLVIAPLERLTLPLIGVVGGIAMALFSVGIGEFLVVYLILRGYPTLNVVALAVAATALTVIPGAVFHITQTQNVWEIALFAIPGAMIGGSVARFLAQYLGARRLEIAAATWIVLSSLYLLFLLQT